MPVQWTPIELNWGYRLKAGNWFFQMEGHWMEYSVEFSGLKKETLTL